MKVLVIGCSGLLGMKLHQTLIDQEFDVGATYHKNPVKMKDTYHLDITSSEDVDIIFEKMHPEVVILTAAYTDVDGCETNKTTAYKINVEGTKNIAKATERCDGKLVYVSTDYVFDGHKGLYTENDATNPINYYGQTKLDGEQVVQSICSQFLIARTSVIYGGNKSNFVTWFIDSLQHGKSVNIVTDQFVSPTLNVDLAEQIVALIRSNAHGVFHTAGGQRISRYEFCRVIADLFGLDVELVSPITMNDLSWVAMRPLDSSLDVSKVSGIKKPYIVREAVQLLQEDMGR
jgi:dTDP-4-dehydrorhamnose reductase